MRNMLCLTVYECKGLEFDEVILFNFFQDSKCVNQWKLLNDVIAKQKVTNRKNNAADFLDFEMLEVPEMEEQDDNQQKQAQEAAAPQKVMIDTSGNSNKQVEEAQIAQTRVEGDQEVETVLTLKTKRHEIYRTFAKVCTELKLLYVAITRPKTLLIVYDEDPQVRRPIQNYWEAVNVVDIISQNQIQDLSLLPDHLKQTLNLDMNLLKDTALSNDPIEMQLKWRLQGFKLFKVKFYQAAIQCFRNSGDNSLVTRCEAYEYADEAINLQSQAEQKIAMYTDKTNFLKKHERIEYKREAKALREASKEKMRQAGNLFNEIDMNKHAAQCFFSSGEQAGAAQVFFKLGKFGQAAECFHSIGKIRKAANLYAKAGLFANAFECYEELQDWEGLLQCLHANRDKFTEKDSKSYIDKYVPIALNSLYQLYANLDPEGADQMGVMNEENKGKVQQMRLRMKFQRSVSIIREEQEIDDEDEQEDENEYASDNEEDQKVQDEAKVQEEVKEKLSAEEMPEEEKKQSTVAEDQNSIVMINTFGTDGRPDDQAHDGESYEILEMSQGQDEVIQESAATDNAFINLDQRDLELEILSSIDPNDEFLQSEKSFSLIDGVSMNDQDYSILSGHSSEFSIISGSKIHSVLSNTFGAPASEQSMSLNNSAITGDMQSVAASEDSALRQYMNSSRFSVIDCSRDAFAEDIVIQKVIYFISLFHEQVFKSIKGVSATDEEQELDDLNDVLDQAAADEKQLENEVAAEQFEANLEKAAFDEDMEFMMIELDNLSPELLVMILDTLERFELYRLSLIICNRYRMHDRNGSFVAAISQKYSNLGQMRHSSFLKFYDQPHLQVRFSLIAQEAMHNVLSLAGQGQIERSLSFREQCFDSLFLQGFWKKLVFMLDAEASYELCLAMQDFESFRLNYLVEKLGVTDPQQIQAAVSNTENFNDLVINGLDSGENQNQTIQALLKKTTQNDLALELLESNLINEASFMSDLFSNSITTSKVRFIASKISQGKSIVSNCSNSQKLAIISSLIEMLKMPQDQHEMLRALYSPFGISWVDGLESFASIGVNYCLVHRKSDSNIMKRVQTYHEASLDQVRAQIISQKFRELLTFNMSHRQRLESVKKHYQEEIQKFMSAEHASQQKSRFDVDVAFPCDIDLDWYLVPKAWARQIVNSILIRSVLSQIEGLKSQKRQHSQLLIKLEIECRKLITFAKVNQTSVLQSTDNRIREFGRNIVNFGLIFEHVVNRSVCKVTSGVREAITELNKAHNQILNRIFESSTLTMAADDLIRRPPKFQIFFSEGSISQAQQALNSSILSLAIQKANEAIAAIHSNIFYSKMLQAFEQFVQCDAYPILTEILTQRKQACQSVPNQVKCYSTVFNLLDAHVFAKVGDSEQQCRSLLAFIREAYAQLTTIQLAKIVSLVFYRSIFALMIHQYKATHQGVSIPLNAYHYIELDQMKSQTIKLPQIFVKQGNFTHVKQALQWMQNLLEGLRAGEESHTHAHLFDNGLEFVDCLIRNFNSDQVFEIRQSISQITNISMSAHYEGMQELSQVQHCKSAAEAKSLVKRVRSSMDAKKVIKYVTVGLVDPKGTAQRYQDSIVAKIDQELEAAGQVESEALSQRKEAAAKIYAFWLQKRAQIKENKMIQKAILQVEKEQQAEASQQKQRQESLQSNLPSNQASSDELYVTMKNYSSKQFNFAKACCSKLVETLFYADGLVMKITGILGSDLIKGAFDQKFVLERMKELTRARAAILSCVKGLNQDRSKVADLNKLVTELQSNVNQVQAQLTEWMDRQSSELASIERSKHRYIKLEKWNTVIQQRKSRKLKLQHLKKNLTKK